MSSQNFPNPFVGLRPFENDESLLFFGRQAQTLELLQRLHNHHFVAVVGSSGSGKSSLIRAGLIPALQAGYLVGERDKWLIVTMKPGENALYSLSHSLIENLQPGENDIDIKAAKLASQITDEGSDVVIDLIKPLWEQNSTNFFLLVDQFEELFRFSADENVNVQKDDAIDFVNVLLQLSQQTGLPVYTCITMRSDFIGDCSRFYGLPEAMNESQYLVPRLNRVQLKNVIEGPVKLYGGKIEPSLTSRLLNDLQQTNDELPLLQHALMRTWDYQAKAGKNILDLESYKSIGGVETALSKHAEEALEGMTEDELTITKKVFQSLTSIDDNGRKIRRPARLSELEAITGAGKEKLMEVINRFISDKRNFLVITKASNDDNNVIDISHESLIRQWNSLSKWVDEENESVKQYLRLVESADLYQANEKNYLTGTELEMAVKWRDTFKPQQAWALRYNKDFDTSLLYLSQSENAWKQAKLHEEEQEANRIKEEQEQQLHEQKHQQELATQKLKIRKNRLIAGIIAFGLVVSLSVAVLAIKNEKEAKRQAVAFRLVTIALDTVTKNPNIALGLAREAINIRPDSLIVATGYKILSNNIFYKNLVQADAHTFISISKDGKLIITGSPDGTDSIYDTNGKFIKKFTQHGQLRAVDVSKDGQTLLTGSTNGEVDLWGINGNLINKIKNPDSFRITTSLFSSGEDSILIRSEKDEGILSLYNKTGKRLFVFNQPQIICAAFSPDGTQILTGGPGGSGTLWNLSGKVLRSFSGGFVGAIMSVAFSPDRNYIVLGSWGGIVTFWDNYDTSKLPSSISNDDAVSSIAFINTNEVVIGSWKGKISVWGFDGVNMPTHEADLIGGHTKTIHSIVVLQNDEQTSFLTCETNGNALVWNREMLGDDQSQTLRQKNDTIEAFFKDGKIEPLTKKQKKDLGME